MCHVFVFTAKKTAKEYTIEGVHDQSLLRDMCDVILSYVACMCEGIHSYVTCMCDGIHSYVTCMCDGIHSYVTCMCDVHYQSSLRYMCITHMIHITHINDSRLLHT